MIIPKVQKEAIGSKEFFISSSLTIDACDAYVEKACIAMKAFLPQCNIEKKSADATITVTPMEADNPEAYILEVKESGIRIRCAEYIGLRNALATFSVLVSYRDGQFKLRETYIEDAPKGRYRGVMLDSHDPMKPYEELLHDVILMAKARMNYLHFDSVADFVELDCLPAYFRIKTCYTKQQMRDLCQLADALGLTVIPAFNIPGHSERLLATYEEFHCEATPEKGMRVTTICPGEPKVFELYEKIIHEIMDVFPSPYFHMCGDEVEMLDLKVECLWDKCPKCRKLREENGLKDRQEEYYYVVKRIYEIVKKAGRTMIMWSDQLDCPRGAMLPDDIIMQFWRVAFPSRGPYEGCSMNAQAALGYKIINSYYPETYTFTGEPIIMNSESLRKWQWDREPFVEEQYRDQILGGELAVWAYVWEEMCPYMKRFLPPVIVMIGDKFWNNEPLEYTEEYCRTLTKILLGAATPDDLNIFEAIGDVLPPTDKVMETYYERVTCAEEVLRDIEAKLSLPDTYIAGDAARAEIYRACAEYTRKMKYSK